MEIGKGSGEVHNCLHRRSIDVSIATTGACAAAAAPKEKTTALLIRRNSSPSLKKRKMLSLPNLLLLLFWIGGTSLFFTSALRPPSSSKRSPMTPLSLATKKIIKTSATGISTIRNKKSSSSSSSIFKKISSKIRITKLTKRRYRIYDDDNYEDDDDSTMDDDSFDQYQVGTTRLQEKKKKTNSNGSRKIIGVIGRKSKKNNNDRRRVYPSYLPSLSVIRRSRRQRRKNKKKTNRKQQEIPIETVEQLRKVVLDHQFSLSDTTIVERKTEEAEATVTTANQNQNQNNATTDVLMDHAVRNLIRERYVTGSTPGNRSPDDNSTLALAIEGGGMRGCVSAGMAAAITALGLVDTIDTIYGSSAGSVVGAYTVSRQVCLDVYVDILPASKKLFVCKKRMLKNIAASFGRLLLDRTVPSSSSSSSSSLEDSSIDREEEEDDDEVNSSTKGSGSGSGSFSGRSLSGPLKERLARTPPGMNISFVLDGIMGNEDGLRPLDIDVFRKNIQKQKLRVVSSCVNPETGRMYSKCFGEDDFFDDDYGMIEHHVDGSCSESEDSNKQKVSTTPSSQQRREGLFACLQASMTVPGATGPPVNLIRKMKNKNNSNKKNDSDNPILSCFDAFCFEPIPYRSAVEDGATHVLVLPTKPETHVPKTKPGIYETGIAPIYFHSHGHPTVAKFFENGGQQYLYAEDLLLLKDAERMKVPIDDSNNVPSSSSSSEGGILVPPPNILYGVPMTNDIADSISNRETKWNRAHLLPLTVPSKHKELEPLEQDKDAVLEAVRGGFETAFDALSDLVGLDTILNGKDVAELVFPSSSSSDDNNNNSDEQRRGRGQNEMSPSSSSASSSSRTSSSSLSSSLEEEILGTKLHVPGEPIPEYNNNYNSATTTDESVVVDNDFFFDHPSESTKNTMMNNSGGLFGYGNHDFNDEKDDNETSSSAAAAAVASSSSSTPNNEKKNINDNNKQQDDAATLLRSQQQQQEFSSKTLLEILPGFQDGRYGHLAKGLREGSQ